MSGPAEPAPPDLPPRLEPLDLSSSRRRGQRAGPGLVEAATPTDADAHDLRLRDVVLRDVDLGGSRLVGADLLDVVVERGSLSNAVAREATLRRVAATGTRATGLDLTESVLRDVGFEDCRLDLALFRFARLESVAFVDCRLDEADFYGATLVSVCFERCTLSRASFDAATFERCELRDCRLDGLEGVERLRGARMPWPDVVQIAGLLAVATGIEVLDE